MGWSNNYFSLIIVVVSPGGFTGLFVYSPSPGKGNLIASVTGEEGTDPYGNPYNVQMTVYGATPTGGTGPSEVNINSTGGQPEVDFPSGAASEASASQLLAGVFNQGMSDEQIIITLFGPTGSASPQDWVSQTMYGSPANAPGEATGSLLWDWATGANFVAQWGAGGFGSALCSQMAAVEPGTSGTTIQTESWHNLALNANFTAGTVTPQYQYEAVNGGRVRLRGGVGLTANFGAGSQFAALPSGWQPANGPYAFNTTNNLSGYSISDGSVEVKAGGSLVIVPAGSNGNSFFLDGITFPLD